MNARPIIKADCIKFITTFRCALSLSRRSWWLQQLDSPSLSPVCLFITHTRTRPSPPTKQATVPRGHPAAADAPPHQPPDGHAGGGADLHGALRRAAAQRQGCVRARFGGVYLTSVVHRSSPDLLHQITINMIQRSRRCRDSGRGGWGGTRCGPSSTASLRCVLW